jgi:hypothetical protein
MLYGDILRKLSKVCEQDYLNSNELCKSLKAMECFFKYLPACTTINSQSKLPGKENCEKLRGEESEVTKFTTGYL